MRILRAICNIGLIILAPLWLPIMLIVAIDWGVWTGKKWLIE